MAFIWPLCILSIKTSPVFADIYPDKIWPPRSFWGPLWPPGEITLKLVCIWPEGQRAEFHVAFESRKSPSSVQDTSRTWFAPFDDPFWVLKKTAFMWIQLIFCCKIDENLNCYLFWPKIWPRGPWFTQTRKYVRHTCEPSFMVMQKKLLRKWPDSVQEGPKIWSPGQSLDCHSASEVSLMDMGKSVNV